MKNLKELRDIDDKIFEDFKVATDKYLQKLLFKSEFPRTAEVCYMFMSGSNFLKNSIFDCAEKEDYYSTSVLFRSIIEHFLRFEYFWFNNAEYKDDSYALKFRTALDFKEKIEIEKSINAIKQLRKIEQKSSDEIWDELISQNNDFEKFSKAEISEFSNSLSIKNIIRFIQKTMKEGGFKSNDFLQKLIIEYTNLSSFVHGGLYAHKKMVTLENDSERQDAIIGICGIALQSATTIKSFSYLTFNQFMPEFGFHFNKTNELLKEITK